MINYNKVGKYLLYAIGEIVLIAIGILIALQLNNINEASKNEQLEINYLRGILGNIDEDIPSLQDHIDAQTYKMNAYTILIKSFTEENIRSDHHLLKHASLTAYGTFDFDPQRNIFDGMKSSGMINLIQSTNLLNLIQGYYVQTKAMVNAEVMYNEDIVQHQRQIYTFMLNMNSLREPSFELKWQSKLDDDILSFFAKDANDKAVKEFANRITDIKANTQNIIFREKSLLTSAKELKKRIREYLGEAKDEESDEITGSSKIINFIPSSPQNAIPITEDQLTDYIGTFELVRRESIYYPFSEEERIHVYIENNHLVVYFQIDGSSYSFYLIENDEFKRAMSFLFDDSRANGLMKFSRNEDNKIINVVDERWDGISHYKKID